MGQRGLFLATQSSKKFQFFIWNSKKYNSLFLSRNWVIKNLIFLFSQTLLTSQLNIFSIKIKTSIFLKLYSSLVLNHAPKNFTSSVFIYYSGNLCLVLFYLIILYVSYINAFLKYLVKLRLVSSNLNFLINMPRDFYIVGVISITLGFKFIVLVLRTCLDFNVSMATILCAFKWCRRAFILYNLGKFVHSSLTIKNYWTNSPVYFFLQTISLTCMSVWSRAAGPRFRLDQIFSLTWKELFVILSFYFLILGCFMYFL